MIGWLEVWLLLAALAGAAAPRAAAQTLEPLCFNQLQVLGTHNSYHQAPPQELLRKFGGLTAGPLLAWQFSHPPLTSQLDSGVRAFELDAYWDPQGGTYAQAAGMKIAGQNGWLTDPRYKQPGFKVLHVPDFDFRTSCILLSECLGEVKRWSDANPRHLPIRVYIEVKEAGQLKDAVGELVADLLQGLLKDSTAEGPSSFVQQPVNTAQTFRDLNTELAAAFGADGGQLLTPDGLRETQGAADGASLAASLLQAPPGSGPCPWPVLESLQGKVMVVLIQRGGSGEAAAFQEAFPDLKGSLAWLEQDGRRELPGAVFRSTAISRLSDGNSLSLDLPANVSGAVESLAQAARDAVAAGYLVRVRADADTVEARAGFTQRRDALFGAGAHVVASDFVLPAAEQRSEGSDAPLYPGSAYRVALPGGCAGRCLRSLFESGGGSGEASSAIISSTGTTLPVSLQAVEAADGSSAGDIIFCGSLEQALAAIDDGAANTTDAANSNAPTTGESSSSSSSTATDSQPQPVPQITKTSAGVQRTPLAALVTAAAGLFVAAAGGVL